MNKNAYSTIDESTYVDLYARRSVQMGIKMNKYYTDVNAEAINKWSADGWEWGKPISHEEYLKAVGGEWDVILTPQIAVPHDWFAPFIRENKLTGVKILGLASGGGQQIPIFAALGANVTVLDYSDNQLKSEKIVADREAYEVNIVKADMTKTFPFGNDKFDIIFHPVSNCYVEDVYHIWNECYRILKPRGVLLAGMDNGLTYMFEDDGGDSLTIKNKLPYNPLNNPVVLEQSLKIDGSVQFSHSLEEQIGGQLKAGFVLTHLREDRDREGILSEYFPQYILTRAIKAIL